MALFAHGFRPFFLMAALVAPVAIGLWALTLAGFVLPEGPLPMMAGAVALMIVAVMTRATLGHTGNVLVATPATVAAYVLLLAAALLRVVSSLAGEAALAVLMAAALCWVAGFVLFLVVYAPMLMGPRAGGKPG
jgi:uncharacterized protein involved in response to NO